MSEEPVLGTVLMARISDTNLFTLIVNETVICERCY